MDTPISRNALALFEDALDADAPRKFIVVHLMGSHGDAKERYPPEHSFFDLNDAQSDIYRHVTWEADKQAVNEYDNSIRFQDAVLSRILGRLQRALAESKSEGRPDIRAAMIYVSDHGEEVKHVD